MTSWNLRCRLSNLYKPVLSIAPVAIHAFRRINHPGLVLIVQRIQGIEDRLLLAGYVAMMLKEFDQAQQLFLVSSKPLAALQVGGLRAIRSIHRCNRSYRNSERWLPKYGIVNYWRQEYLPLTGCISRYFVVNNSMVNTYFPINANVSPNVKLQAMRIQGPLSQ